jgi:hypothetical protein
MLGQSAILQVKNSGHISHFKSETFDRRSILKEFGPVSL